MNVHRLLATTSADHKVRLWNTTDYSFYKELTNEKQRWVHDCAFSSDSQYIITGDLCTNMAT